MIKDVSRLWNCSDGRMELGMEAGRVMEMGDGHLLSQRLERVQRVGWTVDETRKWMRWVGVGNTSHWDSKVPEGREFPAGRLPYGPVSLPPHCWRWSMPGWPPKQQTQTSIIHSQQGCLTQTWAYIFLSFFFSSRFYFFFYEESVSGYIPFLQHRAFSSLLFD